MSSYADRSEKKAQKIVQVHTQISIWCFAMTPAMALHFDPAF
jgi:hypothetical protein